MTKPSSIHTHLVAIAILCGFAVGAVGAQENNWSPAKKVDLAKVTKATAERAKADKLFVRQPTILAYRTALFLAGGSFDTPTRGRVQSIKAEFAGGEQVFRRVTVAVEFMGYPDDSLFGERFTISLSIGDAGNWSVVEVERAAYGRGDHR